MNLLDLMVKIGVQDNATSKIGAITSGIKTAVTASAGAAVAAVGAISGAALSAYSDYEQLTGGVETLFKGSADTIKAYAEAAYNTAGVSANSYMEQATAFSAALIQNLGGDTQAAADYVDLAIKDMSDNANKMGTDLSSIQATYQSLMRGNYAMLDNLKLGYGGTKSELQRMIKDANAYKESIGEVGDLSADNFADVIEAIHLTQEQLGITGTTALEAATTIEGSVNTMKAAWSNWLAGLGNENADMGKLTEQLVSSVETAAQNIIPRLGVILGTLGTTLLSMAPEMATQLGTAIGQMIADALNLALTTIGEGTSMPTIDLSTLLTPEGMIQGVATLMETLSVALQNGLMTLATNLPTMLATVTPLITTAIQTLIPSLSLSLVNILNTLAVQLPTILGAVLPAILTSLTTFLTTVITQLPSLLMSLLGMVVSGISSFIATIGAQLPTILPQLLQALLSALNNLVTQVVTQLPTYVSQLVQAAVQFFRGIVDALPQVIPVVIQGVADLVNNILTSLPGFIGDMISAAVELFTGIVEAIPEVVPAILDGIADLLQQVWDSITSFDLVGAGTDLIQGLIDGIVSMGGAVIDAIGGVVGGAIDWAKGMLGIASPSKLFHQFGVYTMQGFEQGIDAAASGPIDAMSRVVDSMTEGIGAVDSAMSGAKWAFGAAIPSTEGTSGDSGAKRVYNRTENNYIFNQPVRTPAQTARAIRMQQTYGLAGARA